MGKNATETLKEGSLVGFRVNKNEDEILLKFLEFQSNRTQALKYLIEKEIAENGVRDLSTTLPTKRDLRKMIVSNHGKEELANLLAAIEKNEEYVFSKKQSSNLSTSKETKTETEEQHISETKESSRVESSPITEDDLTKALMNIISKEELNNMLMQIMMKMFGGSGQEITRNAKEDKENKKEIDEDKEDKREVSVLDSGEIDISKWANLDG